MISCFLNLEYIQYVSSQFYETQITHLTLFFALIAKIKCNQINKIKWKRSQQGHHSGPQLTYWCMWGKKNITKEQDHAWLYKSTIKEKKSAFCTSCKWRRDYLGWAWNIMRLVSNGVIMVWFTLLRSVMAFCRCVMSKSCSGVIMGFYWLWKWISRSSTNVDACLISSEWKS